MKLKNGWIMQINPEMISVQVKLCQKERLLAQVEVIFLDIIETKGWRIMPSEKIHPKFQEHLWIQPPAYRFGFKWHTLVFVNDKKLYEEIEEKIYNAYRSKLRETGGLLGEQVADQVPF